MACTATVAYSAFRSFRQLTDLHPVQFNITPVDSVQLVINRNAVGPNDFRCDDFLPIIPAHSVLSNVRMRSPICPDDQSALRMNGDANLVQLIRDTNSVGRLSHKRRLSSGQDQRNKCKWPF